MDVTPLIRVGQQVIQSYAGGKFKVSGQVYDGPVIVFPDGTMAWDVPGDIALLKPEHFETLTRSSHALGSPSPGGRGENVDVVLLGVGKTMKFMDPGLKKTLKDKGLAVDVMDTGAACRTYNVLMAEGRRVAAALLPSV